MSLNNIAMVNYAFLEEMYSDSYFPDDLVKKCEGILIMLCEQIETKKPSNLNDLYVLTHAAVEKFNDLQDEFWDRESEIETVAREAIGKDFRAIAAAYGFADADAEELIATRDW